MEKKEYGFTLRVDKWDGEGVGEYPARGFIPQAAIEIAPSNRIWACTMWLE